MTPNELAQLIADCISRGKRIYRGKVLGANNAGGRVQVEMSEPVPGFGRTINAIALNDCIGGSVTVFLDDTGRWLALSSMTLQQGRVQNAVYRKRKQVIPKVIKNYPIKILFSILNTQTNTRTFYVGGDREKPTEIFSIPEPFNIFFARITNTGIEQDNWIVGLRYQPTFGDPLFVTRSAGLGHEWQFNSEEANNTTYIGHGFWSGDIILPNVTEVAQEDFATNTTTYEVGLQGGNNVTVIITKSSRRVNYQVVEKTGPDYTPDFINANYNVSYPPGIVDIESVTNSTASATYGVRHPPYLSGSGSYSASGTTHEFYRRVSFPPYSVLVRTEQTVNLSLNQNAQTTSFSIFKGSLSRHDGNYSFSIIANSSGGVGSREEKTRTTGLIAILPTTTKEYNFSRDVSGTAAQGDIYSRTTSKSILANPTTNSAIYKSTQEGTQQSARTEYFLINNGVQQALPLNSFSEQGIELSNPNLIGDILYYAPLSSSFLKEETKTSATGIIFKLDGSTESKSFDNLTVLPLSKEDAAITLHSSSFYPLN